MTGFAYVGSVYMVNRLTACDGSVMATETRTNHLVVIHCTGRDRCPGCRSRQMAGITQVCCINVIAGFTTGSYAIMTAGAGANHVAMVYYTVGDG